MAGHSLTVRTPMVLAMVIGLSQFIISADYSLVFVALPTIGRDFGAGDRGLEGVVSVYAAAFAGCVLLAGRVTDVIGGRRMFLLGAGLFAVGSVVAAVAVSLAMLLIARVVQGISAAALFPAGLALIAASFPAGPRWYRALAIWGSSGAAGMSLGSLSGGSLTSTLGWRAVFVANMAAAAVAAFGAHHLVARALPRHPGRALDLFGGVVVMVGVSTGVVTLMLAPRVGWTSPAIGAGAAGVAAAVVVSIVVERRGADPLLPWHLLAQRRLASAAVVTFLLLGSLSATLYLLTSYLQRFADFSALDTGIALLPLTGAMITGMQVSAWLLPRTGEWSLTAAGLLTMTLALAGLGLYPATAGSYGGLAPCLVAFGMGCGLTWTAAFTAATARQPEEDYGLVAGLICMARQLGSAALVAALTQIMTSTGGGQEPVSGADDRFRAAAWLTAGLTLLGTALALAMSARSRRPTTDPSSRRAGGR